MNKLVDFVWNDAPTLVDIRRIRWRKWRRSLFIHAESTRKAGRGVGTRWKWSIRRTSSSTKPVLPISHTSAIFIFCFCQIKWLPHLSFKVMCDSAVCVARFIYSTPFGIFSFLFFLWDCKSSQNFPNSLVIDHIQWLFIILNETQSIWLMKSMVPLWFCCWADNAQN